MNQFTLVFAGAAVALAGCRDRKPPREAAPLNVPQTCYAHVANGDRILLSLTVANNRTTGHLLYAYTGKDKNEGTLVGEVTGDTLLATYTFASEGTVSTRAVAFLRRGTGWVEGYGPTVGPTGQPDLRNRAAIKFVAAPLMPVSCNTNTKGCLRDFDMQWSPLRNACVNLAREANRLTPVTATKREAQAAFFLFNADQTRAELYLPTADTALLLERKGNEGNYTWRNGEYSLAAWKGYVLRKAGVPLYGAP